MSVHCSVNASLHMGLIAWLWLGAIFPVGASFGKPFVHQIPVLVRGAGLERNHGLEEEHESNGPEGSAGVPMERMSVVELGLALAVLLGMAGWVAITARRQKQ